MEKHSIYIHCSSKIMKQIIESYLPHNFNIVDDSDDSDLMIARLDEDITKKDIISYKNKILLLCNDGINEEIIYYASLREKGTTFKLEIPFYRQELVEKLELMGY
jgi:hypothetical protein